MSPAPPATVPIPAAVLRASGLANVLAGLAVALFMIEHPWGRFVGAEVGGLPQWQLAHSLHFLGAVLAILGLFGLAARQAMRLGPAGWLGFALAVAGTAMFVGTGMITAFIWPMLARQLPSAVGVDGAIFLPPAVTVFAVTAVTLVAGYLLFGAASWRAGVLPRPALALWALGGSLGMVPPQPLGPLPWPGLVLAALAYGAGAAWLGLFLWRRPAEDGAAERPGA
jgi:hypothetical protein